MTFDFGLFLTSEHFYGAISFAQVTLSAFSGGLISSLEVLVLIVPSLQDYLGDFAPLVGLDQVLGGGEFKSLKQVKIMFRRKDLDAQVGHLNGVNQKWAETQFPECRKKGILRFGSS